jgi:hypothetical protein
MGVTAHASGKASLLHLFPQVRVIEDAAQL